MAVVKRIAASVFVLVTGAAGVALLAPGGLGDPQPQVVTSGPSARMYLEVVAAAAQAPGWLSAVGELGAVGGLLVLAMLLAWTGWTGWRRRSPTAAGAALVGLGAVLAYLASEAVKLVVDEQRPCRALTQVQTWVPCPPPGDWSFPSNHATVAAALAAGLVLIAPRRWVVAVPAAAMAAGARVVTGVHYPHDVLAGLLLGAASAAALLLWSMPVAHRVWDAMHGQPATPGQPSGVR